ncbi:MAG: M56 family metallopeptidase [Gemmatimonadota bacterium]
MSDVILWAIDASARVPLLGAIAVLLFKTSGVLLLAALIAGALGRSSAAKRHLVWTAGIAGAVLLPLATLSLPAWRIPVEYRVIVAEPAPSETPVAAPNVVSLGAAPKYPAAMPPLAPATTELPSTERGDVSAGVSPNLPLILCALWILGALVTLAPWFAGVWGRGRLAANASDLLPGAWERALRTLLAEGVVPQRVRVLAAPDCGTPMTWGVVRPIVLVPADTQWTDNERRNALLHEFAHVRRADYLAKLLARMLCALYWFNPMAWIAARAERLAREQACDDAVLRAGSRPSSYAQQLLDVAHGSSRYTVAAAALTMARPSSLAQRLRAILDSANDRSPSGRVLSSATVVVACALLPPVAAVAPDWVHVTIREPAGALPNEEGVEAAPPPSLALPAEPSFARSAPAIVVAQPQAADCTPAFGKKSSTSINRNDSGDPTRRRWQVKWSDGACRIELDARGTFTLSPNADDITALSAGGYVDIEQDDGRTERRVRLARDGEGLTRTYWVNGDRREWNSEASAWLARVIVQLDRRTAFAVDSRLPLLLQSGGVDGVIAEVSEMPSGYAQRIYYGKLFQRATVGPQQLTRILESAARTLDSGYEKAELLLLVAKQRAFAEPVHLAYAQMARGIDSDYEKRRALGALLSRDDLKPAVVQTMLEATEGMQSDYELAELLTNINRRYAMDATTRPFYVRALATIESDYEQRRVLSAVMRAGDLGPAATAELVSIAGRSMKGYELAEFLVNLANKGALDSATSATFFAAARSVGSDYERGRVLHALLAKGQLTPAVVESIIGAAAAIESDYECAQLLIAVARAVKIDDSLKPAYERAAATIGSDYEYGRAMSAVRRSAQRG